MYMELRAEYKAEPKQRDPQSFDQNPQKILHVKNSYEFKEANFFSSKNIPFY